MSIPDGWITMSDGDVLRRLRAANRSVHNLTHALALYPDTESSTNYAIPVNTSTYALTRRDTATRRA